MPGSGWSSPVVAGEQIWLTAALDEGRSFHALCVNTTTGKLTHDIEVFARDEAITVHPTNSYASPTAIKPGAEFEVLATNKLGEKIMASPAIVDKAIYLRTAEHLYRLEMPPIRH